MTLYAVLVPYILLTDKKTCRNFCRMDTAEHGELLALVTLTILMKDTNLPRTISPEERIIKMHFVFLTLTLSPACE